MRTCEVCEHIIGRAEEATLCQADHEWDGKILCLDCLSKVIEETQVS